MKKPESFVRKFKVVKPDAPAVIAHRKEIQKVARPLIEAQARRQAYSWQQAYIRVVG